MGKYLAMGVLVRRPFEFQTRPHEPLTLQEAVFQALGAASICWENIEAAGTFNSSRAKEIGEKLIAFIEDNISAALNG